MTAWQKISIQAGRHPSAGVASLMSAQHEMVNDPRFLTPTIILMVESRLIEMPSDVWMFYLCRRHHRRGTLSCQNAGVSISLSTVMKWQIKPRPSWQFGLRTKNNNLFQSHRCTWKDRKRDLTSVHVIIVLDPISGFISCRNARYRTRDSLAPVLEKKCKKFYIWREFIIIVRLKQS